MSTPTITIIIPAIIIHLPVWEFITQITRNKKQVPKNKRQF
jgi:hypothetical protein